MATHSAAVALFALVRDHDVHARGLADDAPERLDPARDHVCDKSPRPDAADFLVVRQREVQRALESPAQELGNMCETDGAEAFHVGHAAAVEPVTHDRRFERCGIPGLAIDRHDVGVSRKNDAADRPIPILRRQRREEIGLAPLIIEG